MKMLPAVFAVSMLMAVGAGLASAADVSRLEWGGFVVENDSSGGWNSFKSAASDDGNSVRIAFTSLEAKADGSTLEADAKLSGHYDISQPGHDRYSGLVATLEGHIIKSGAAVARIVVKIGDTEKVIEWPAGEAASEKFKREITFELPNDGRLPSPFALAVETYARKDGQSDAAYVSLDHITIAASGPRLAEN